MTNAERLGLQSDLEELARHLANNYECPTYIEDRLCYKFGHDNCTCADCWYWWLIKEV